jgi:uncharacterized membrane protein
VSCLTLVGAMLRLYRIGSNSLWVDEFATLKIVRLPFAEIARAAAEVSFCPPLHFWLVHGVVALLGVSETSLRLVSAIAGALTIPVAWLLIRELTRSRRIALLGAALLAVNPLHIWYSQEGRGYALLVLMATAALLCFVLAARTGKSTFWAGFAAFALAAVLTHTIAPVILVITGCWMLLSHRRLAVWRPFLVSCVLVGLAAAPSAMMIAGGVAQASGTHSPPRPLTGLEMPYTLLTFLAGYSFGPATRDIQNLGPLDAIRLHAAESAIAAVVLTGLILALLRRHVRGRFPLLILCLVPILAMLLGSATSGKAYQARYALAGVVGFCGLSATAVGSLRPAFRGPAAALILTLSLWADGQWYFAPRYWKDDSRGIVTWLTERLPRGSTVLTAPDYVNGVLSYYADRQAAPIHLVGADSVSWEASAPAALLLTRLHHVAQPESLRARFRTLSGERAREDTVGGYQVIWTDQHSASPSHE